MTEQTTSGYSLNLNWSELRVLYEQWTDLRESVGPGDDWLPTEEAIWRKLRKALDS